MTHSVSSEIPAAGARTDDPPRSRSSHAAPTLEEFEAAQALIAHVAESTPLESSRYLAELLGVDVWMKCENLQRTGSFKIRGAYNRIAGLTTEERARGVVAASAGNHAQGVAFAAREMGIKATIFMPLGVPLPKLQATKHYGADIVLRGLSVEEPLRAAAEYAAETGAVYIPPFDHRDVIAGQGTLGLEIFDEVSDVDTVIVPVGGGGLVAGVASAIKQKAALTGRTVRVIGVQAANAAAYPVSLQRGEPTEVATHPTIADGIAVRKPGLITFDIIRDYVDEIVTVTDDELAKALVMLLERAKLVVEPAGSAGVAAILAGKISASGSTVVILSGGNIDPLLMQNVISHGLAAADRYLTLRIPLPDRPGQLARTSEIVAQADANVLEVHHTRHRHGLKMGEVELELSVETRGAEHRERVIEALRSAGYEPEIIAD